MGAPWEKYQTKSAEPKGPWSKYGTGTSPAEPPKQVNYQDATDDPTWIKNARTLYKEVNKADPKDDYEATTFLKDYLYDFNYRLAGSDKVGLRNTFGVAGDVASFSPEGKKAFLDAQQQFENFDVTLPGMMEAGERILTDPTSFIGITGFGGLARQGVKTAAKEGVEELAKIGVKRGAAKGAAVGAAEGGAYAGASDLGQQMAQVNAGGQETIDPTQVATSAGYGAIAGGGLGGVAGGVGGYFAGRNPTVQAARRIADDPEVASRGAEITQRMAGLQDSVQKLSPETYVGKEQVNANLAPLKGDVKYAIDQLGLDKNTSRKLKEGLDKASGISDDDIAKLRGTPEGNAVAENILFLRQANAMTRPIPNDGIIPKAGRFAMDKLSPVPLITDPLKSVLFPARISGELRVDQMVSPRNRKIAEEILRLQGQSAATRGRQELLDAGLNMARARKVMRETKAAEEAAERAAAQQRKATRDAEADRLRRERAAETVRVKEARGAVTGVDAVDKYFADQLVNANVAALTKRLKANSKIDRLRSSNTAQNVRTNTGLGRQQLDEIKRAAQEAEALNDVKATRASRQVSEEATLNAALNRVGKSISALEKYKKLKERSLSKAAATSEQPKFRSRKFSGNKSETQGQSRPSMTMTNSGVANPIAYQAGTDTVVDFQKRALDAAERYPNKKVGRILMKAVGDMVNARNNQTKRLKAYEDAAEAALKIGPDEYDFINQYLDFLVNKYADK